MNKLTSYTALTLSSAILFTGCSGGDGESSSAPVAPVTVTETIQPEETLSVSQMEEIYLATLRSEPTLFVGLPDDQLLDLGYQTCEVLNNGTSLEELSMQLITDDVDPEFAGYLIGAAITTLCPEQGYQLESSGA